jgi:hypothetical protein
MPPIELTTTVLPGGKIEVRDSRLIEGAQIHILCTELGDASAGTVGLAAPSILELLRRGTPNGPLFKSPQELDEAIERERQAWD